MGKGRFATAVNCMDGRTQVPVNQYLKKKYEVDYVDTITQPGPNKILAEGNDDAALGVIKKMLEISIFGHDSRHIAIVGHADCAGNPADQQIQINQIEEAVARVKSWGFDAEIIGLWLDEDWVVSEVCDGDCL
jgi:hypothetical protein